MGFGQAISAGFSNYVNFSDRACRSEYWYWILFIIIAEIVTGAIDVTLGVQFVTGIFGLRYFPAGIWRSRSGGCTISTAPAGGYCSV